MHSEDLLLQIGSNRVLKEIRMPDLEVTASPTVLQRLITSGAVGLDSKGNAYDESNQCSGLAGQWILSDYTDAELIVSLNSYFVLLNVISSLLSSSQTMSQILRISVMSIIRQGSNTRLIHSSCHTHQVVM